LVCDFFHVKFRFHVFLPFFDISRDLEGERRRIKGGRYRKKKEKEGANVKENKLEKWGDMVE